MFLCFILNFQLTSLIFLKDKVKINSLSMVAEDHAESSRNAAAIYNIIRKSLVSDNVHCDRKLPLVYVVDSILKNVKGQFIPIVEKDASDWLPVVYQALPTDKRAKLEKVWKLWKNTFEKEKWEEMGKCFSEIASSTVNNGNGSEIIVVDSDLENAGLSLGVRQLFHIIVCFSSNSIIDIIIISYTHDIYYYTKKSVPQYGLY